MKNKIIAVDFDGTLCESAYPDIGAPKKHVIERIKKEQQQGAKIILWTCRGGEKLAEAVYWSIQQGLIFDAINENLLEISEAFGHETRKIYADEYWDDRAVFPLSTEFDTREKMQIARAGALAFSDILKKWLYEEHHLQTDLNGKFQSLTAAIRADEISKIIDYVIKEEKALDIFASKRD